MNNNIYTNPYGLSEEDLQKLQNERFIAKIALIVVIGATVTLALCI